MSIRGIGTDIIEIARVRELLAKRGESFLARCFTEEEIAYCTQFQDPAPAYAARFAAKEAVAKALGTGFGETLAFQDISILREESGKPVVKLSEQARDLHREPKLFISMSHCKEYAVATAVIS